MDQFPLPDEELNNDEVNVSFQPSKNLTVINSNDHIFHHYDYDIWLMHIDVIIDTKTGYFNFMHMCNYNEKTYKEGYSFLKSTQTFKFMNYGNVSSEPLEYVINDIDDELKGPYIHPSLIYAYINIFSPKKADELHKIVEICRTNELIEKSIPKPVIISSTDDIITDPTSGKQFKRYRYFDHIVIQDTETGLINAGKFIRI